MIVPNRIRLAAAALGVVLAGAARPAQEEGPGERAFDSAPDLVELGEAPVRIPFTLGSRRPIPVVRAMVDGQGPFAFYYDTGASVCVLDSGFVEELGIPVLGATEIGDHTATARIPAERVKLESLELEGVFFAGVPAVAFDRSRLEGATIRGVLGLPLFREHLLTVDYAKSRLEVSTALLPEGGEGVLPFGGDRLPEITIAVAGREVPCYIDSGSPAGFMFPAALVEDLPHKSEPQLVGKARTVNSEFEVWSVQLAATVVVAGNEYVDPRVGYNEILPNGNIGYQILKDLELSIDQRSKRVRLVPARPDVAGERGGEHR